MQPGKEILYLSDQDVTACGLSLAEVEDAVERMFAAKAAGRAAMKPKLALHAEGRPLFLASAGMMEAPLYAGVKWVGVADGQRQGLPHIAGVILLSDAENGMPVALLDARWVTAVRTAAITAVAARRLARPESASIGFIACGLQARAHLAALRPHFPIARVHAYSRRLETAQTFAEEVRALGLAAEAFADPQDALEGVDIAITSTPVVPRTKPFLDAAWLAPGSFAGMVDLGFSWISESLRGLDRVVTDDTAQAGTENLAYPEPYDGEVMDLVSGALRGRETPDERTALVFAGIGLADVAVAAAVYERAAERQIGRVLPL
jgi:ornithine cyclodeaminase/alanine dehydrogenase